MVYICLTLSLYSLQSGLLVILPHKCYFPYYHDPCLSIRHSLSEGNFLKTLSSIHLDIFNGAFENLSCYLKKGLCYISGVLPTVASTFPFINKSRPPPEQAEQRPVRLMQNEYFTRVRRPVLRVAELMD